MSTLSDIEFQRIQDQLLELKTNNYSLEDKLKKQENEINFWKRKSETLEKQSLNPLSLARNLTRNSAKNKDLIEKLSQEITVLQQRIESQESEFRVTNDTLRDEIGSLLNEKQRLQQKVFTLKNTRENVALDEPSNNKDETDGTPLISYAVLAANEELENRVETLNGELEEICRAKKQLEVRLEEVLKDNEQLEELKRTLTETIDLSEARKTTIEEMKDKIEELKEQASKELAQEKLDSQQKIDSLQSELCLIKQEKESLENELAEWKKTAENLKSIASRCENLEDEVSSLTNEIKVQKAEAKEQLTKSADSFRQKLHEEMEKHAQELRVVTEENQDLKSETESLKSTVGNLEQQVKDIMEERKIHEKKGLMMVKELKRQLHSERKRAEKLQEKLEEVLSEKSYSTITIDVQPKCHNGNDSSSVGSWSFMSSHKENGDNSGSESKHASPVRSTLEDDSLANVSEPGSQLEKENSHLVTRITELQQEKWTLEEKISQLEVNNASIVEKLNEKIQLIEYYCIEGRTDHSSHHSLPNAPLTVKRVFDFIKAKGDENLKDINRRLLRMLEEILTKNMHLEKNLEILSNENAKLLKMAEDV